MALIKCPECGREISNMAKACIHCGYPLEDAGYYGLFPRIDERILDHLLYNKNSRIEAIKYIRARTSCSLEEAKDYLYKYEKQK